MKITKLLHSSINVLFSDICPICRNQTTVHPCLVCNKCLTNLNALKTSSFSSSDQITEILSLYPYYGMVRKCIHEFKYNRRKSMINIFEAGIKKTVVNNSFFDKQSNIILPVPVCKKRHKVRGFNQAGIIGHLLSRIIHLPIADNVLIKTKNTIAQIELSKSERKNNVKNSFALFNTQNVVGKSIILVDDVVTTGATLDACAKELFKAGAKEVRGFTLARTL